MEPYIFLESGFCGQPMVLEKPERVYTAFSAKEAQKQFLQMEKDRADGCYLAGYVSYEAAFLFEPKVRRNRDFLAKEPLFQIGAFRSVRWERPVIRHVISQECVDFLNLVPAWSYDFYEQKMAHVREWIASGDVYQINLSFPLEAEGRLKDPVLFYERMRLRQRAPYGAVIALGGKQVVSFSPEMFFRTSGRTLQVRPMKGTAPRGKTRKEDVRLKQELLESGKQQAENLMIVDLMRHDLSRLCRVGSVTVPQLFSIETYPSLHQMTSCVQGEMQTLHPWHEIFRALFPCGSVTGAPKIRAMEIISALEDRPRGVYCGAIGVVCPDGAMCWNVAIRTLSFQDGGRASFPIGSGIVWDSKASLEYEECLLKATFLQKATFKKEMGL